MRNLFARIPAILLALWLSLAAPLALAGKQPMWEIRDPASGGTVYLLGSIHVCKASCLQFPDSVMRRFRASPTLAVELDPASPDTIKAIQAAMLMPEEQSFWNRLEHSRHAALQEALAVAGLSPEAVGRVRPPMLAAMMSAMVWEKLGYSQRFGVDQWFMRQARESGKSLRELETIDQQLNALLGGNEQDQLRALLHDASTIVSGRAETYMARLVAAWQAGDLDSLDRLTFEEFGDYPEIHAALLLKRNVDMADKMQVWLNRGETVFAIVGAAHIAGHGSVAERLEAAGFQVRQLDDTD